MKLRYLPALALAVLLTGCSLVAAFIPPIEVSDPLGLDGQSLTLLFGASNASSSSRATLTPQAVSQAQAAVTRTFDDQALDLRGFFLGKPGC